MSNSEPKYEDFVWEWWHDGETIIAFEEEKALAYLLQERVCFLNVRPYITNPYQPKEKWEVSKGQTIVVYVNCSDTFAWGGSDGEELSTNEDVIDGVTDDLHYLLKLYLEDKKWGSN